MVHYSTYSWTFFDIYQRTSFPWSRTCSTSWSNVFGTIAGRVSCRWCWGVIPELKLAHPL